MALHNTTLLVALHKGIPAENPRIPKHKAKLSKTGKNSKMLEKMKRIQSLFPFHCMILIVLLCLVLPSVSAVFPVGCLGVLDISCVFLVLPSVLEVMGSTQQDSFAKSHKGNRVVESHAGSLCADAPPRESFFEKPHKAYHCGGSTKDVPL